MPTIATLHQTDRSQAIHFAADVAVWAGRDDKAEVKISFRDFESLGPACTTVRFMPAEFAVFADEVQQRRKWLGV